MMELSARKSDGNTPYMELGSSGEVTNWGSIAFSDDKRQVGMVDGWLCHESLMTKSACES